MEVCGLPPDYILQQGERKQVFFDGESNMPFLTENQDGQTRIPGSKPIDKILQCQSASFIDFITKCLAWDPSRRINPLDALMHPWIIEGLPPQVLVHHK